MSKNRILIFSSDPAVISPLKGLYDVEIVFSRKAALKNMEEKKDAVVIIDRDIKELDAASLFRELRSFAPDIPVIMLSSSVTIQEAVDAAKTGIADFIKKPFLKEKLLESVKKSLSRETVRLSRDFGPDSLWLQGSGERINAFLGQLESAMAGNRNLIFISEPGTDVYSIARIIHEHSGRGKKLTRIDMVPFQKEGAENIFWTVLQGAILDSDTVYFDNFEAVPGKNQPNIVDYIRSKASKGQARIIFGIHGPASIPLFEGWEKLNVPPLRDRKEDMAALLEAYIDQYSKRFGKKAGSISLDALGLLAGYDWPGNYRELECVIEDAVLACGSEGILLKDIKLGSRMLTGHLLSNAAENLKEFSGSVEKKLVNILYKKLGSEETVANLLDIPKTRVSENIDK